MTERCVPPKASDMTDPQSMHLQGEALLDEMEKTIPLKVGFCAAHMMLSPGSVVLDAGCANGETTAYFAMKYPQARIIGVDYDSDFINAAKTKFDEVENADFIQADLRDFDIGATSLDVTLNLSVHHEFQSFTGYRTQTVIEVLQSQLGHTRDYGLIMNRDFNKSDRPDEMVFLALPNDGAATGDNYADLSVAAFFLRYAKEAMRSGETPEATHRIKGFFAEEYTERLIPEQSPVPEGWRVFAVQEKYAREFIWRMQYRDRFLDEARERYAFWTHDEHRAEPEKLGARVLYSAPYENPWIMENWYQPNAKLFNRLWEQLPLPPSNFISVYQKIPDGDSIALREHRVADTKPTYLEVKAYRNTQTGALYDLVSRPGGDVVDVLPFFEKDGKLFVLAKDRYPRPIANTKPRMISPNLDDKRWSGHMIEPLSAANIEGTINDAIRAVLSDRAGLQADTLLLDQAEALHYYPAPSDLNERVTATRVEIMNPPEVERALSGRFSGFSNDGVFRPFDAQSLLQATQTGMLPEARLETNIYALMRERGITPGNWLGQNISVENTFAGQVRTIDDLLALQKDYAVYEEVDQRSHWLRIQRSQFHEVALADGSEHVVAASELEFILPTQNVSTNSVILACLARDPESGEILIGTQKLSASQSQFAAAQLREGHSGLIALPGYRLPTTVEHIQDVPAWISGQTGLSAESMKRLGEGYFPSLGVMPNRIFPFASTDAIDPVASDYNFVSLRQLFIRLDELRDLHLINAVFRTTHALGVWTEYAETLRRRFA